MPVDDVKKFKGGCAILVVGFLPLAVVSVRTGGRGFSATPDAAATAVKADQILRWGRAPGILCGDGRILWLPFGAVAFRRRVSMLTPSGLCVLTAHLASLTSTASFDANRLGGCQLMVALSPSRTTKAFFDANRFGVLSQGIGRHRDHHTAKIILGDPGILALFV